MAPEMRPFEPKRDAEPVSELVRLSFGGFGGPGYARYLRSLRKSEWKNERCLWDGDRIVAYLSIRPKDMYIGRALLKVAGIAAVCTHPETRGKGYGRMLFDDTLRFMERDGYDISVLYGIPDYYHKFGYEVVMSRHFITIPQDALPEGSTALARSALTRSNMRAVCALYNEQTRFRDGNCLRRSMDATKGAFKLSDRRGRIMAYAYWWRMDGTMGVNEAIARDATSARELLIAFRRIGWREGLDQINIQMAPGYHVTDLLRSANSIYHRGNTYRRGCMGRVVNVVPLVRKMQAEWSERIARSELAARSGSVALAVGRDVISIRYGEGRATATVGKGRAASMATQERFIQMIHGYRSIADLAEGADVSFRRTDLRALEVLFPERNAFLFVPDHF